MSRQIGGAGYTLVDFSEIEYVNRAVSLLRWGGFPLGRVRDVLIGGGGYSRFGRWMLDGDGAGSGASGEDARYQTGLGSGFGGGGVGYLLVDTAWLKLYPLAALGSAGGGYAVNPKTGGEPTYAYSVAPTVSFGLGVELRLPISRRFSPMIGVRVGYRRALLPYQSRGNGSLELPPKARGGLFFRLIAGAGVKIC